MALLRVTFVVDTDADPSTVLDAANEVLPDLIEAIEAYDESCSGDPDDIMVEELGLEER